MLFSIGRVAVRRGAQHSGASTNRAIRMVWLLHRVNSRSSTNSFHASPRFGIRCSRSFATTTKTVPKPKAKSTTSTKDKSTTKVKKPAKKIAKKVAKKKVVKKPAPKVKKPVKKVLTEAEQEKATLKALKQKVLSPPALLPHSAWSVLLSETVRELVTKGAESGAFTAATKSAAARYKSLSPQELESYNHKANANKAANDAAFKEWLAGYTPDEIRSANNARVLLRRKLQGKKPQRAYPTLADDRLVKRSPGAFGLYVSHRMKSGDFKGVDAPARFKLMAQEWKELAPSAKKEFEEQAATDKQRYAQEFKTVYNRDSKAIRLFDQGAVSRSGPDALTADAVSFNFHPLASCAGHKVAWTDGEQYLAIMDMGTSMTMGGAPSDSPLNASGIDFSNSTQATTFLGEILDDTEFQVDGNMYARNFWYGVCGVIGTCAVFNMLWTVTLKLRMRAAAANRPRSATPGNIFSTSLACITAIFREATYSQFTPRNGRMIKVPPIGTITLLVGYLAWVVLLEFVDNNVDGAQHFTSLGVRAAWLAVAQVPLLILLAGKNNLIGFVSGVSYERLNVIHRWAARVLLFLVTLHMLFLHLSWNAYELGPLEYSTDSCIPTGWATYAILIWMNISTIAPIRNFSYEFFVVQHIITFFGFIIAVMMHLPSTALYSRVYIYIPIALYLLDRIIRSARYAWNNVRPGRATLMACEGGVTKIRVQNKSINKWAPGSHVFLSIPKFGIGQSHPATIASTPNSHGGDLVFILKGHKGFTSRVHLSATNSSASLLPTKESSPQPVVEVSHLSLIDGPYGSSHPDFAAFDSVILLSGSTGVTFTLPILLDIAHRAQGVRLPVKRISFVWIIKNTSWISWISKELDSAYELLHKAGIELDIRVHVTCDEAFTNGDEDEIKDCGCECDKSVGPCCCVNISEDTNSIREIVDEKGVVTKTISTRSRPSPSLKSGKQSRKLTCASFHSGRPDCLDLIWDVLEMAEGETGVGVCGPLGLNADNQKEQKPENTKNPIPVRIEHF
ncbi:hypothetical protein G7Y89_g1145 [Cudoniella acicularis]|uniref:HMG box domain-containing protein n=1 Tax=Cudoniella acicularis TaxID=354080 RepID=A0A8H4RWN1_9HELO|nr:hypothetical protein G7Y89_g1145 [Cudoniella acicularis]